MPTFYDLKKYAATGIAYSDMTQYDKLKAIAMFGGGFPVSTISGIPPLSFKSDGTPITVWSMKGNGSQTGTPTPDNPILPEFVGTETANLFDKSQTTGIISGKYINQNGVLSTNQYYYVSYPIRLTIGETYTWSFGSGLITHSSPTIGFYDSGDNLLSVASHGTSISHFSFTVPQGCAYIRASVYKREPDHPFEPMLISGTVPQADNIPLPWYEPFGYKIPITCGGETTPVYLGLTQRVQRIGRLILYGTENWLVESEMNGLFSLPNITSKVQYADQMCTHFALATSYSNFYTTNLTFAVSNRPALLVHYNAKQSVSDFKQWLADEYAAGHPVTVWYIRSTETTTILSRPLCGIGDYADELHSTDAGVAIPTVKGSNTLTVDTELQPSEVSITGHIKAN